MKIFVIVQIGCAQLVMLIFKINYMSTLKQWTNILRSFYSIDNNLVYQPMVQANGLKIANHFLILI
jgi:hypothetical protein